LAVKLAVGIDKKTALVCVNRRNENIDDEMREKSFQNDKFMI